MEHIVIARRHLLLAMRHLEIAAAGHDVELRDIDSLSIIVDDTERADFQAQVVQDRITDRLIAEEREGG